MRRRVLKAMAWIAVLAMIGGPAAAHDFTGAEEDEKTLECPYGKPIPANQEPPGAGECTNPTTQKTYQGYVWDNDVKCASGGTDAQAAKIYTSGGGTAGGVGVCNDGTTAPVQGRVVVEGDAASQKGTIYADGDKDNSNEQAQGFARLDVSGSGPTMRCGDGAGNKDASHPGSTDGQDDCG